MIVRRGATVLLAPALLLGLLVAPVASAATEEAAAEVGVEVTADIVRDVTRTTSIVKLDAAPTGSSARPTRRA